MVTIGNKISELPPLVMVDGTENIAVQKGKTTYRLATSILNGSVSLKIRKVYNSVSAMNSDGTRPTGSDGTAIKPGEIVSVYNPSNPSDPDNNSLYAFQNPGWLQTGKLTQVDSELDENSTNPVENRVVTNKIFYLDNNKYDKIYNQDKTIDSTVKSGTTYIEVNFIKDTEYYITLNFLNFIQPDIVNGIYTYNKQSSGEIVENIYDKLVESPYNTVAVKFIPNESCVYIGINCSLFSESEQQKVSIEIKEVSKLVTETQSMLINEIYGVKSVSKNNDGIISSADITWQDGQEGKLVMGDYNDEWMAYDSYSVSYKNMLVIQPKVTRDDDGNIIVKPNKHIDYVE